MGCGGPGNFDNDAAMDWMSTFIRDPLLATINEPHDEATGDYIIAAVETLAVLCEAGLPVTPIERETVRGWREAYLACWHGYIDGLEPAPGHKEARLKVIEATFARIEKVARA